MKGEWGYVGCGGCWVTSGRTCIQSEGILAQRGFCILCGSGSARCESFGLEASSFCYIPEPKVPDGTGAAPAMFARVSLVRPTRLPEECETPWKWHSTTLEPRGHPERRTPHIFTLFWDKSDWIWIPCAQNQLLQARVGRDIWSLLPGARPDRAVPNESVLQPQSCCSRGKMKDHG